MNDVGSWDESDYQEIAMDTLALLWDYCDLLARGLDSRFLKWWNAEGREMRARCLTSVKASNVDDVAEVAGFVSEYRHFLQDTTSDSNLMFWLTETVAQIHNRFTIERTDAHGQGYRSGTHGGGV
jgi:hypothetical protein